MKIILLILMTCLLLTALKTMTGVADKDAVYKVKEEGKVEDGRILNKVPQWFVDAKVEKGLIQTKTLNNLYTALDLVKV